MVSLASQVKFKELCECLEKISKSKKPEKLQFLQDFIAGFRKKASELREKKIHVDTTFYPIMRLLLPSKERERGPYGLKETKFAKKIINIMCFPPRGPEAINLMQFRSSQKSVADFAEAAYWVLRKKPFTSKNLSITEVNNYLDAIAKKNADNDADGLERCLFQLFKSCSPDEQKWLIRMILKDLRLGLGEESILDAYHPDAANLFSNNSDLKIVCNDLFDNSKSHAEIDIKLFEVFRPMLLRRCDAFEFSKRISDGELYYIEAKFDGERSQMHMRDGKFKFFTRNGFDFTHSFGDSYDSGIFTPLLKGVFKDSIENMILDGEMMGWNKKTKKFGSKGMNFDVKHLNLDNVHQPCYCAFDIVFLNDEVLTKKSFKERLDILKDVFTPVEGTILLSELMEAHCKQDILDALNLSVDKNEEGVVIKHPSSTYEPNSRNAGWWKLKLEYFEDVMSDLDVVIMGGYYGDGRNINKVSSFLVGVAVNSEENQEKKQFMSLARIKTGLSDEELELLNKKLNKHWIKKNHEKAISYGMLFGKDVPDVWIKPENSCILQVRASELTKTVKTEFKSNYTLRFPRVLKVRYDKLYYECLTVDELNDLTAGGSYVEKLSKRHLYLEDIENMTSLKKKKRTKYEPPPFALVEQQTSLLEGYQFSVLSGDEEWTKEDIEKAIRENGGSVVRTEGTETTCILVGKNHPRISSLKTYNKQYDLVKIDWLKKVITNNKFTPYRPTDTIFMCKKTYLKYHTLYDKYGDSYTELLSVDSLKEIFAKIDQTGDYIISLPIELECLQIYDNAFKDFVAYFDKYEVINLETSPVIYNCLFDVLEFKFYGGEVRSACSDDVNLVIMKNENEERRKNICFYFQKKFGRNVNVMACDFIHKKIKRN